MGISSTNPKSKITRRLSEKIKDNVTVLDVGASNGYARIWRAFGEKLTLHGFDPLVNEMRRLQEKEKNPNVKFHSYFVGEENKAIEVNSSEKSSSSDGKPAFRNRQATFHAKSMADYDQIKEKFNSGKKVVLADRMIRLDTFLPPSPHPEKHHDVDFIKVDTDGHDIQVLRGATEIINSGTLLGLDVEVRFLGPQGDRANIFRNIDRMLADAGFSLFHLEPKKYSRAALPRVFLKNRPTISPHGQVRWANAIYLRDLGAPGASASLPIDKVLKAICLFDLYDLPDVAAEIILQEKDRLGEIFPVDELLNLITPEINGQAVSYAEYMSQFEIAARSRRFEDFGRKILD